MVDEGDVHTIQIELDTSTGRFRYRDRDGADSDRLRIRRGDTVEWVSDAGPWAVQFGPLSPLDRVALWGGTGQREGATVRGEVPYGKYDYFVAVWCGDRVWTDDPRLDYGGI